MILQRQGLELASLSSCLASTSTNARALAFTGRLQSRTREGASAKTSASPLAYEGRMFSFGGIENMSEVSTRYGVEGMPLQSIQHEMASFKKRS